MEGSCRPAEKCYLRARRHSSAALSLQAPHLLPPAFLPSRVPTPGPQERDPGQVGGGSLIGACSYVISSANIKKEGLERKDTISSSCRSPFCVLWIFVIITSGLLMIKCNYAFVVDRTLLLISPVTPPKRQANKPGHTPNLGGECKGRVFSKTCHLNDISFKNITVWVVVIKNDFFLDWKDSYTTHSHLVWLEWCSYFF